MSDFLPVTLKIKNQKILLIGGGKVAFQKISVLVRFTSNITILAKEIIPQVRNFGFPCIKKEFEGNDLDGFNIVYACTNQRELNKNISSFCKEKGILINVVDNIELSDFISPAVYVIENMTVSVGSDGMDVRRSIEMRNRIREFLEKENK